MWVPVSPNCLKHNRAPYTGQSNESSDQRKHTRLYVILMAFIMYCTVLLFPHWLNPYTLISIFVATNQCKQSAWHMLFQLLWVLRTNTYRNLFGWMGLFVAHRQQTQKYSPFEDYVIYLTMKWFFKKKKNILRFLFFKKNPNFMS